MEFTSLLDNLKTIRVKLKCDRCKGYLMIPAIDVEKRLEEQCRCGGTLSAIESIAKWKYRGYDCEIKRNNFLGIYMGYVLIKKDNYLYGKSFQEINNMIVVHGGLTYSDYDEDQWKIGFDTGHGFDYIPIWRNTALDKLKEQMGMYVWTQEGVKKEVEKMVDQVIFYSKSSSS